MQYDDAIVRARAGDADAFAEAFEKLRPRVFAVACRLVGVDAAEDVVMETYLKAWRSIGGFRGQARLTSWLYRITHNCAMDHIRRIGRVMEVSMDAPDAEGHAPLDVVADPRSCHPGDTLEASERASSLDRALACLSSEHRAALLLRYADGLSYVEIAAATGVAVGTVMSRLFNAKRKMRGLLDKAAET